MWQATHDLADDKQTLHDIHALQWVCLEGYERRWNECGQKRKVDCEKCYRAVSAKL